MMDKEPVIWTVQFYKSIGFFEEYQDGNLIELSELVLKHVAQHYITNYSGEYDAKFDEYVILSIDTSKVWFIEHCAFITDVKEFETDTQVKGTRACI